MHKVQLYAVPLFIYLLCGLLTIGIDPRRNNAITQGRRAVATDMALLPGRFSGNTPAFRMGVAKPARPGNSPVPDRRKPCPGEGKAHQAVAPP